jgi:hypothetical protein
MRGDVSARIATVRNQLIAKGGMGCIVPGYGC